MPIWIKIGRGMYGFRVPRGFKIVYQPRKGLSLFSDWSFKKGERIIHLRGKAVERSRANPEAVQIDDRHFLDTDDYVPEDFINHSCNPNTRIDILKRCFVALRDIPKNTELSFNYLTTEYDMKKLGTDFVCRCGAKDCYGRIKGFKYLTPVQKGKLRPYLSPFLLKKLAWTENNQTNTL